LTAADLIAFEDEVAAAFAEGKIRGPVHLCGGNEAQIIDIFKDIRREDWVFSTYRNHYHALLHGVPREHVMAEVMGGRNMNLTSAEHRFFTSAIVGGTLPIAVGVAAALKRNGSERHVWCFVGDMCATTGAFHEATEYAFRQQLPITFVEEDNGYSADSPTVECWGLRALWPKRGVHMRYTYERTRPHAGIGRWVDFK
jgi:TPP-dependent pyruvate/acetoin dehydrogenase alpha subunit